jgi:hypothetical protein
MKKMFIIAVIALVPVACSSLKSGKSADNESSGITVTLERMETGRIPDRNSGKGSGQKGMHGPGAKKAERQAIYRAQEMLKQNGYNPGPLDGIWGPKTQQAALKFQKDNGLPATGKLDNDTSRQLMLLADGGQQSKSGSGGLPGSYSLMENGKARQLIEKHIQQKDIPLDIHFLYRKFSTQSDSENPAGVFQGIMFDNQNYLVLALCEPGYRMVKPSGDLSGMLAPENLSIPDEDLSFTFNGVVYTSVDLRVKRHPVFLYTEQGGFIANDQIPKGGYRLMVGQFGMNLGNTFIIFTNPLPKKLKVPWSSEPDAFMIKMSRSKENGILLNLY